MRKAWHRNIRLSVTVLVFSVITAAGAILRCVRAGFRRFVVPSTGERRQTRLGAAGVAPTTTVLGVSRLAIPTLMVEPEGTAVA